MSITNGYCTLAEIRGWTGVADTSFTGDDTRLEESVESASRYIDDLCGRRFYTTTNDETRYYTASDPNLLTNLDGLDDIYSITTLKTDEDDDRTYETTWAVTDYDLAPYNAALDGKPYTRIDVAGDYEFPTHAKGVQIVGKFGWGTAPKVVKRATLILAAFLLKQKDVPLGMQASSGTGQIYIDPRISRMIEQMLRGVRKSPLEA